MAENDDPTTPRSPELLVGFHIAGIRGSSGLVALIVEGHQTSARFVATRAQLLEIASLCEAHAETMPKPS